MSSVASFGTSALINSRHTASTGLPRSLSAAVNSCSIPSSSAMSRRSMRPSVYRTIVVPGSRSTTSSPYVDVRATPIGG